VRAIQGRVALLNPAIAVDFIRSIAVIGINRRSFIIAGPSLSPDP